MLLPNSPLPPTLSQLNRHNKRKNKVSPKTVQRLKLQSQKQARLAKVAEDRYARDLRGIAQGYHQVFLQYLEQSIRMRTSEVADAKKKPRGPAAKATGAYQLDLDILLTTILPQIAQKVGVAFDRLISTLTSRNADALGEVLGVKLSSLGSDVQTIAAKARERNIKLVENAGRAYAGKVREVFEKPENFGVRYEVLKEQLGDLETGAGARAELIARDQTLKTLGQINGHRQSQAGVTSYIWSTSKDERVRPEHAELEGQIIPWDSPPSVGHPGQDFQCRCVALPYIPELDGI